MLSALPAHQLLFIGANLTGSRLLYLGSAGMAIFLAIALSGVKLLWFRRVALFGALILFSFAAFFNMDSWRSTSKLSQKLLKQIVKLEPSPPSNTVFIFHNMPTTVRGVFYFRVGLQEAIRMAYSRHDLGAIRAGESLPVIAVQLEPLPVIHLEWNEDKTELIEKNEE